jgi:Dolichyl-phosphate-mannose-protein mannosyltransferase
MDRRRVAFWLGTAAALAGGLGLRLWFIARSATIAGDTLIYGAIAKNWMQQGVYGFSQTAGVVQPTLIRLPGYPLFLIACFRVFGVEHYTSVMCVQCVIDLLSCLLLSALAGRLFGSRARMITLWLAVLCPFTASYVGAPLTETLTLACIVVAFYGLERWRVAGLGYNRWLWVIAVTLSYAILLRPEQGLLAAAVVPAMLWMVVRSSARKGGWIRAAVPVLVASVCVLLPLVPWTARNWRAFHVFQPLAPRYATDPGEKTSPDFQRWYRTWAIDYASTEDVYWNYDGAPIQISDLPTRAFDSDDQYARTEALLEEYNETSNDTPALEARFAELAKERIQADPIRYYLALPVARVVDMALRPRTETFPTPLDWWNWKEYRSQTVFVAAYGVLNLAYFVLAGFGIAIWRRRGWGGNPALAWAMLASILLRCALLLTLDNSETRYTLEFFPVLFLCAGIVFAREPVREQKQIPAG